MPASPFGFDVISIVYLVIAAMVVWRLVQNWSSFWDDFVTGEDLSLAASVAFFVLLPIEVFAHEAGHAIATWLLGGTVVEFSWRVYWGFIVPAGDFTAVGDWWISVAGTLASILVAALALAVMPLARKRIVREVLYRLANITLIFSLVIYPLWSLVGMGQLDGDWVRIYDFSVAPYAQVTLVLHGGILLGLWLLDRSGWMARWRTGARPRIAA